MITEARDEKKIVKLKDLRKGNENEKDDSYSCSSYEYDNGFR